LATKFCTKNARKNVDEIDHKTVDVAAVKMTFLNIFCQAKNGAQSRPAKNSQFDDFSQTLSTRCTVKPRYPFIHDIK